MVSSCVGNRKRKTDVQLKANRNLLREDTDENISQNAKDAKAAQQDNAKEGDDNVGYESTGTVDHNTYVNRFPNQEIN